MQPRTFIFRQLAYFLLMHEGVVKQQAIELPDQPGFFAVKVEASPDANTLLHMQEINQQVLIWESELYTKLQSLIKQICGKAIPTLDLKIENSPLALKITVPPEYRNAMKMLMNNRGLMLGRVHLITETPDGKFQINPTVIERYLVMNKKVKLTDESAQFVLDMIQRGLDRATQEILQEPKLVNPAPLVMGAIDRFQAAEFKKDIKMRVAGKAKFEADDEGCMVLPHAGVKEARLKEKYHEIHGEYLKGIRAQTEQVKKAEKKLADNNIPSRPEPGRLAKGGLKLHISLNNYAGVSADTILKLIEFLSKEGADPNNQFSFKLFDAHVARAANNNQFTLYLDPYMAAGDMMRLAKKIEDFLVAQGVKKNEKILGEKEVFALNPFVAARFDMSPLNHGYGIYNFFDLELQKFFARHQDLRMLDAIPLCAFEAVFNNILLSDEIKNLKAGPAGAQGLSPEDSKKVQEHFDRMIKNPEAYINPARAAKAEEKSPIPPAEAPKQVMQAAAHSKTADLLKKLDAKIKLKDLQGAPVASINLDDAKLKAIVGKKPVQQPEQSPARSADESKVEVVISPYQPQQARNAAIQHEFTTAEARDAFRKQLLGGKKIDNYFEIFQQEDQPGKFILRIAASFKETVSERDEKFVMGRTIPEEIKQYEATPRLPEEMVQRWRELISLSSPGVVFNNAEHQITKQIDLGAKTVDEPSPPRLR